MKSLAFVFLAVVAAVIVLAVPAVADETITLEGKVLCAKCILKEDLDKCQNVLAVEEGDTTVYYYMEGNDANKEFGDVCTVAKEVKVTGTISEKDGKMWIAATEIVTMKKEG